MTTIPCSGGRSQDLTAPAPSVAARLNLAEDKLHSCRQGVADARGEVRNLRRLQRRERRRELRAMSVKATRRAAASPVALTLVGGIAFLVAVALLMRGMSATNTLALAAAAWGGAAAIHSLRT
ncbi:hypothetical protein ACFVP3_39515 [Streptomyces sp. NPDC057806]|uniref:hypothetical protein n=1 Tax=Streptomyces sp. NPDC057806 TaxID=3346255 RepID=UPI0036CEE70F